MDVQFKNNAFSTLAIAIDADDLSITVATSQGSRFSTLTGASYFYLTIEDTIGAYEIVKVTARSNDVMTIVRAQEGTTALAFAAGASCEQRVTGQSIVDAANDPDLVAGSLAITKIEDISTQRLLGRDTAATGAVEQVTINSVLGWLSTTQGSVLYRGASSWAALAPGTAGQVFSTNGAGANPAWITGTLLTDGDKGDITVSSSGGTWTIDSAAVSLAKMANLSQYSLIGRSSSGSGVPEAIATSSTIYTLLGSASASAARTNLGLGTIATQAASAIALTGGTITGLSSLAGTMKVATNTTGTLALADANCFNPLTGGVTINGGVFNAREAFLFYAGAAGRTITQGSSMTLRLGGSATTGNRSLAAYTLAVGVVINTNTVVITGNGVT